MADHGREAAGTLAAALIWAIGAFAFFIGLGFAFQNWISLAVVLIPTFFALLYRVRVEETALIEHFGDRYRDYMARTRRFV